MVVTEVTSGSSAGWWGKGYVAMRLPANITASKISVTFEDAVVNDCYELVSGRVLTEYDPNWKGVADVDGAVSGIVAEAQLAFSTVKDTYTEILDKLNNYDCSTNSPAELDGLIGQINNTNTSIQGYAFLNSTEKQELTDGIAAANEAITCKRNAVLAECQTSSNSRTKAIDDCGGTEELSELIENVNESFDNILPKSNPEPENTTFDCSYPEYTGIGLYKLNLCESFHKGREYIDGTYFGECGNVGGEGTTLYHLGVTENDGDYYMFVKGAETEYLYVKYYSNDCKTVQVAKKSDWLACKVACGCESPPSCPDLWTKYKMEWGSSLGDDVSDAMGLTFSSVALAFTGAEFAYAMSEIAVIGRNADDLFDVADATLNALADCSDGCTVEEIAELAATNYIYDKAGGVAIAGLSTGIAKGLRKLNINHLNRLKSALKKFKSKGAAKYGQYRDAIRDKLRPLFKSAKLFTLADLKSIPKAQLPAFVRDHLDDLLDPANKSAIWDLTDFCNTCQFNRGNLIEAIYAADPQKYGSYQNLNDVIPNYPTLDFDGILNNISEVVSLKTFQPRADTPKTLSLITGKIDEYAQKLVNATLHPDHEGKRRVLDFVIKKGEWDDLMPEIRAAIREIEENYQNEIVVRLSEF